MLKALCALVVLAFAVSDAAPNNMYYTPYMNTINLSANKLNSKILNPTGIPSGVGKMMPKIKPATINFCQGRTEGDRLPFPDNRSKFIMCHHGETYDIMECPTHLVFNIHTSHCENSFRKPKGCESNPCINGGECFQMPFSQYRCECPVGFHGKKCQIKEACAKNECGPTGVCVPMPLGSPMDSFCMCDGGNTYGLTCKADQVEANPCITNDDELHSFPVKHNKALFMQCEGHIPHLKNCAYPLVYSHQFQRCDWEL
jgi:hypothetical protein